MLLFVDLSHDPLSVVFLPEELGLSLGISHVESLFSPFPPSENDNTVYQLSEPPLPSGISTGGMGSTKYRWCIQGQPGDSGEWRSDSRSPG